MNPKILYPNLLWILPNIIILALFGFLSLIILCSVFGLNKYLIETDSLLMFMLSLFTISFFFLLYFQLSSNLSFAKIKSDKIIIIQPLKLTIKAINFNKIKGYSNSEYSFGHTIYGHRSRSFIIYTNENKKYEFIKIFNLNFINFRTELKNKVKYLGAEPYKTGILFRKYKY